jgi:hypothetical protein
MPRRGIAGISHFSEKPEIHNTEAMARKILFFVDKTVFFAVYYEQYVIRLFSIVRGC